jgi:hypothetical protein
MKKSNVKDLLDKRKVSYTMKDTKFGEIVFQCVIFRKIAKIIEGINHIIVEFPFGEFPQKKLDNVQQLELYLGQENGGK